MYTPEPDEKFDFQNMDVKLYLALKDLRVAAMHMVPDDVMLKAERALYEFQQSFGPIPDWAVDRNFAYELVPGAQLCTRDGRRTGNAHIVRVRETPDDAHYTHLYDCLTDAGSKFTFSEQELETAFTIGDWISDPARIIKDFDRNGEFQEQPL